MAETARQSLVMTASRLSVRSGRSIESMRDLPEEVPVALVFNGTAEAVMMASPADLEDFGVGFALTEGFVSSPEQIEDVGIIAQDDGCEVRIRLSDEEAAALSARRRKRAGPVGCGLCGVESIDEALRALPDLGGNPLTLEPADLTVAIAAMEDSQRLRRKTGALHAAGFYVPGRGLLFIREDVGRHNALDKVAGALARAKMQAGEGVFLVTSRLSVDLVQKAAMAGCSVLVAASAPTALAVRTAESCGMTLVAHARNEDFDIYSRPDRITEGARPDVA